MCGVEQTVGAVKAALVNEKLGQGSGPDILAVSFSGHDITGHKVGPDADIMKAMTLAEDRAIADIRAEVARKVPGGLKNVVFVLTGDHGVGPLEDMSKVGIDAGRIDEKDWLSPSMLS